jgi:hypothetical protein
MIQFEDFADDSGVAIEMALPETVMEHHDWLRFLAVRGIRWAEVAAEQGRDAQRRKGVADAEESDDAFGYVASGDDQVTGAPSGDAREGMRVSQFPQLRS